MWLSHLLSSVTTTSFIVSSLIFFSAGMAAPPNGVCDVSLDTGLYEDPSGNSGSYLRCSSVGYGTLGMWKSESCFPGQIFRFSEQRCTDMQQTALQTSNNFTAILNSSCAQGEECTGGTVCDPNTMRCLCPVGNLETPPCNPVSSWFHSLVPTTQSVHSPERSQADMVAGDTALPIVFNVQVPPGSSCANGEVCVGGSLCTLPMKACLCPGDMEDIEGQCQAPQRPTFTATAGLGAGCNDAVQCTNGSMCIDGRCQCPVPLVQRGNQCTVKIATVEVGPGELCDKGQVCTRGSVCHEIIPVCICPANTVLQGDSCLPAAPGTSGRTTEESTSAMQKYAVASRKFPVMPKLRIELGGGRQAGVGAPCQANIDCMIGAFCKANTSPATCQCLSTHVSINGLCEKVIYPGRNGCRYDAQCSVTYPGAKCSSGQCICPDGLSAIEQTCKPEDRVVQSPPGGSCTVDGDCTGGSTCQDGWCICPEPSMTVADGICIKLTPLATTTENNWPAANVAAYDAKISTAQPDPVTSAKVPPSPLKMPGSSCGPLDQCSGGSTCLEGLCLCPIGLKPSVATSRCEPKTTESSTLEKDTTLIAAAAAATRAPGHECEDDTQCSQDRICIIHRCKCKSGFIERNGSCVQVHETSLSATTLATVSTFRIPVSSFFNSSVPLMQHTEEMVHSTGIGTTTTVTLLTTATSTAPRRLSGRPRITGPPLRRSRPQTSTKPTYKTRPGNGVCPPGNHAVHDESTNYLVICNGEKPLCPPKSYCYVTGYADQEYNCCKA